MVKLKLTNTNPTGKGIAKRIPPKRGQRSHKKKVDSFLDCDIYTPPPRKTTNSILDNATVSFGATASGNAYKPKPADDLAGLDLDANGGIEFRTGDTPAGLFSPVEGASWDLPYTPEQVSQKDEDAKMENPPSPERENDFETPERRPLDGMFTPDAPEMPMSKKVITRFVSDYGDNVPESAQEGTYTGPSVTAVVVKTFVPCYIIQMPLKVRTKIYSLVLFPNGKSKPPRPHFSATSTYRLPTPPLLHLCHQIRAETTTLYFSSTIVTCSSLSHLLPWLRTLSPEARARMGRFKLPFDAYNHVHKTKAQQMVLRLMEFQQAGVPIERRNLELVVSPPDVVRSEGGDLTSDDEE